MDFKMNPGVLSVEIEHDAENGTTLLFAKAQCKECGRDFEWSEKMKGAYVTMEIVQDLFLDATRGACAKCRLKTFAFKETYKSPNDVMSEYTDDNQEWLRSSIASLLFWAAEQMPEDNGSLSTFHQGIRQRAINDCKIVLIEEAKKITSNK